MKEKNQSPDYGVRLGADMLDRYPSSQDKPDYTALTDKQYQDFVGDDKNYIIPEVLEDREKGFLPLDDRFFTTGLRNDSTTYSTHLDSRKSSVNIINTHVGQTYILACLNILILIMGFNDRGTPPSFVL